MIWEFPSYPDNWQEIKQKALERARFRCERCGDAGVPLDVHHIISLSKGGTNDIDNLQVLCRKCHSEEHPWMVSKRYVFGKCIFLSVRPDGKIVCTKLHKKLPKDTDKIGQDDFDSILCLSCPVPQNICKHLRFSIKSPYGRKNIIEQIKELNEQKVDTEKRIKDLNKEREILLQRKETIQKGIETTQQRIKQSPNVKNELWRLTQEIAELNEEETEVKEISRLLEEKLTERFIKEKELPKIEKDRVDVRAKLSDLKEERLKVRKQLSSKKSPFLYTKRKELNLQIKSLQHNEDLLCKKKEEMKIQLERIEKQTQPELLRRVQNIPFGNEYISEVRELDKKLHDVEHPFLIPQRGNREFKSKKFLRFLSKLVNHGNKQNLEKSNNHKEILLNEKRKIKVKIENLDKELLRKIQTRRSELENKLSLLEHSLRNNPCKKLEQLSTELETIDSRLSILPAEEGDAKSSRQGAEALARKIRWAEINMAACRLRMEQLPTDLSKCERCKNREEIEKIPGLGDIIAPEGKNTEDK